VRYTLEDVGHNLSFQAKLKAEFGIGLPDLPQVEELSIEDYFSQVSQLIKNQKNWKVIADHIELGFFSFGKFMIYHDLDNSQWPEEAKPVENSLLQSLFKDGFTEGLKKWLRTLLLLSRRQRCLSLQNCLGFRE
jgi:hypothetical protein